MKIKIGCCGFPVNKKEYFKNFGVVEIQQTFYQPPQRLDTIEKWREEAPCDFEYTLKAWQLITHTPSSPTYRRLKIKIQENKKKGYGNFKPTDEVFQAWERIDVVANILGSKIILFQCPSTFLPTDGSKDNMRKFFSKINRGNYIFVWEPRGDWEDKEIKRICKELNLVHCVDPFKGKSVYGDIKYYRLHGIGTYNYQYGKEELDYLKTMVQKEKLETYVMFNNTHMLHDATKFAQLVNIQRFASENS